MLYPTKRSGRATINGVRMQIPDCWTITTSLTPLILPAITFENRPVPRTQGQRAFRRRADQAQHTVGFTVVGEKNHLGQPYSDWDVGAQKNLKYLVDTLPLWPDSNPTVVMTWVWKDGTTYQGDIQIVAYTVDEPTQDMFEGTLEIVIPDGRLTQI